MYTGQLELLPGQDKDCDSMSVDGVDAAPIEIRASGRGVGVD